MSVFKSNALPLEPKCTECKTSVVVEDTREGHYVCTTCGTIIGNRIISDQSEWRSFDDSTGPDPNRVGGPSNPLLGESATLSTVIGRIPGQNSNTLAKYQNQQSLDNANRQLILAFNDIETFVERMSLSQTVKSIACEVYKQLQDTRELRGRNRSVVVTTCIYIACKVEDVPRTLKELCEEFRLKRRDVGRCYKKIDMLESWKDYDS
eukprot:385249_1